MVSSQNLSQSSAKKQQSISSFFTKSTTVGATPFVAPKAAEISNEAPASEGQDSLFVPSDEESVVQPNGRMSSTTPKHALDEEVDTSTPKRVRLSNAHNDDSTNQSLDSTAHIRNAGNPDKPLASITANQVKKPKASKQTSKYAFTSSPIQDEENEEDDEETKRRKAKLHEKFVKRLGRPDSIAEIKRRNWVVNEDSAGAEAEGDEAEDSEAEAIPKPSAKGKTGASTRKGASKLTPMEKQYLDIKRKHLDTILIVEVGYKFKFFGEDARVAAKELSIVCIPGKYRFDEHPSEAHLDRFASASVPVHRLHVHVKRLVGAGHKVGVVRQLETAALKAVGDNRNAPFTRKLTNLYTKGTYIDDVEGLETPIGAPSGGAPATGYLVCITEQNSKGWGTDEKVRVGLVAVQPATGDVIHDDFEDGFMRSEIETRLLHIAPCEILIVGELSKATDKLVQHLSGSKTNVFGDKVRVERVDKSKAAAAQAYSHVSNFYGG